MSFYQNVAGCTSIAAFNLLFIIVKNCFKLLKTSPKYFFIFQNKDSAQVLDVTPKKLFHTCPEKSNFLSKIIFSAFWGFLIIQKTSVFILQLFIVFIHFQRDFYVIHANTVVFFLFLFLKDSDIFHKILFESITCFFILSSRRILTLSDMRKKLLLKKELLLLMFENRLKLYKIIIFFNKNFYFCVLLYTYNV